MVEDDFLIELASGVERECNGSNYCHNASPSLTDQVFCLGKPVAVLLSKCSLCGQYACGQCAKRELQQVATVDGAFYCWRLCCPHCGAGLGQETSGRFLLSSSSFGLLRVISLEKQSQDPFAVNLTTATKKQISTALSQHVKSALTILSNFSSDLPLDNMISRADRAIAEAPGEQISWFSRLLLCSAGKYQHAVRHASEQLRNLSNVYYDCADPFHKTATIPRPFNRKSPVSIEQQSVYLDYLSNYRQDISGKLMSTNSDLVEVHQSVQAYNDQKSDLKEFVRFLSSGNIKHLLSVQLVWAAVQLEGALDYNQLEQERGELAAVLAQTLDQGALKKLSDNTFAYQGKSLTLSAVYENLSSVAKQNNIDLTQYPNLNQYIKYVALSESVDARILFKELLVAALEGYFSKVDNDQELFCVLELARIDIIKRLFDYLSQNTRSPVFVERQFT